MRFATAIWIAMALALGACTPSGTEMATGPLPSGSDLPSTEPPVTDLQAGGQSGTEGHAACSCELGEPLGPLALDSAGTTDYPLAYSPNELFDIVEGVHTFECPAIGTVVVEIARGGMAWLLQGVLPSDTSDGNDRECRGVELDATVRISGSDGLSVTASKLRLGSQCDLGFKGGTIISDVKGIERATLNSQQVDVAFTLWNASTLLLSYDRQSTVHCPLAAAHDAGMIGDSQTADAMP
jgi:hypothetical protein